MRKTVMGSIRFLLLSLLVFGGGYTLLVTGVGQLFFNEQANGSQVTNDGKVIGSKLIGQPFESTRYFSGRNEKVSQLSPVSKEQASRVEQRTKKQLQENPAQKEVVPVDLVTASASGVDPDISVEAANFQVSKIAQERGLKEADIYAIIEKNSHKDWFSDRKYVNVLQLNLSLDQMSDS